MKTTIETTFKNNAGYFVDFAILHTTMSVISRKANIQALKNGQMTLKNVFSYKYNLNFEHWYDLEGNYLGQTQTPKNYMKVSQSFFMVESNTHYTAR